MLWLHFLSLGGRWRCGDFSLFQRPPGISHLCFFMFFLFIIMLLPIVIEYYIITEELCGSVMVLHNAGIRFEGCSVAQQGCSVVQLVARWLAVMQARVRISAGYPMEVPPTEPTAVKIWRWSSANVYEWMMYCMYVPSNRVISSPFSRRTLFKFREGIQYFFLVVNSLKSGFDVGMVIFGLG